MEKGEREEAVVACVVESANLGRGAQSRAVKLTHVSQCQPSVGVVCCSGEEGETGWDFVVMK